MKASNVPLYIQHDQKRRPDEHVTDLYARLVIQVLTIVPDTELAEVDNPSGYIYHMQCTNEKHIQRILFRELQELYQRTSWALDVAIHEEQSSVKGPLTELKDGLADIIFPVKEDSDD